MSRIAKQNLKIPNSVECLQIGNNVVCRGPLGEINLNLPEDCSLSISGSDCKVINGGKLSSCMHGTIVANLKNALLGVMSKFEKKIKLVGVGYKVSKTNNCLNFNLGYSHAIEVDVPEKVEVEVLKNQTDLILKSIDKRELGDFCAKLAKLRKVEPYKGKGVVIEGQFILRKEGKRK